MLDGLELLVDEDGVSNPVAGLFESGVIDPAPMVDRYKLLIGVSGDEDAATAIEEVEGGCLEGVCIFSNWHKVSYESFG